MKTVDIKYLKRSSDGLDASGRLSYQLQPMVQHNIIDCPTITLRHKHYCEHRLMRGVQRELSDLIFLHTVNFIHIFGQSHIYSHIYIGRAKFSKFNFHPPTDSNIMCIMFTIVVFLWSLSLSLSLSRHRYRYRSCFRSHSPSFSLVCLSNFLVGLTIGPSESNYAHRNGSIRNVQNSETSSICAIISLVLEVEVCACMCLPACLLA